MILIKIYDFGIVFGKFKNILEFFILKWGEENCLETLEQNLDFYKMAKSLCQKRHFQGKKKTQNLSLSISIAEACVHETCCSAFERRELCFCWLRLKQFYNFLLFVLLAAILMLWYWYRAGPSHFLSDDVLISILQNRAERIQEVLEIEWEMFFCALKSYLNGLFWNSCFKIQISNGR